MSEVRKRPHKLPVQQLAILALVRFAEPIALTSVFPYLPAMIESFPHVKKVDVGFWTGMAAAIFSLAQCTFAIAWGRASDRFGRKPIMLLGVFNTMLTSLLWGFSTTLPMALTARALSGAGNGNVGILRTMVAELCPWKELQPRAFSLMPLVFSIGSVIGPALGGALSNPYNRQPGDPPSGPLLWRFPFALPNMVAAGFFLFGIVTGFLFLEETLAEKKYRRDPGLVIGKRVSAFVRSVFSRLRSAILRLFGKQTAESYGDHSVYTAVPADEESVVMNKAPTEKQPPPRYVDVLGKQTVISLIAYWLLAMHNTAYDQVIAVFMHQPRKGSGIREDVIPPFTFNRGLGMVTSEIGVFFMIDGFAAIFFQFVIFPPLTRKYGSLNCLRAVLHAVPFVYLITPFTALFADSRIGRAAFLAIWIGKSLLSAFSFPCTTIILTNTAPSLRVLGTVNGIATSIGAIGRAIGPTLAGSLFTWGVKTVFLPAPFVLLCLLGILNWIPLYFMEEGDGFGDDDEEIGPDHEEYEEHALLAGEEGESDADEVRSFHPFSSSSLSRTAATSRSISQTPTHTNSLDHTAANSEAEGEDELSPLLTRQSTTGSRRLSRYASVESSAVSEEEYDERAALDVGYGSSPRSSANADLGGAESQAGMRRPSVRRRRSSVPIGSGPGFRRMSSNLGTTRSGYGTGRALDGS